MATELRYAHAEGQTWVAFSPSGKSLVTGGVDGDVRVYEDFEDDDPKSFRAGKQVHSMAVKKGTIATGIETNLVQLYTFQGRADGIAARMDSPSYCVAFSHDGQRLAAGGSDFSIKVPIVTAPSQTKVMRGHEAPVLSLAFDAQDEYLASASCDGSVRVWKVAEEKAVHVANVLEKGNDLGAVQSICGLSWQPKAGDLLAIPVKNSIQFLQRLSWKVLFTLDCSGSDKVVNTVTWSVCGKYLAAGTTTGDIFLFDVSKKTVMEHLENPNCICSMQFHPKGDKQLVFADMQGQMGLWEDVPIGSSTSPLKTSAAAATVATNAVSVTGNGNGGGDDDDMADEDLAAMVMDMDDGGGMTSLAVPPHVMDESSNVSATSSTMGLAGKKKTPKKNRASFLDDSASDTGDDSDDDEDAADAAAAAVLEGTEMIVDESNSLGEWPEEDVDGVKPEYQEPTGMERLLSQTLHASAQLKEQKKAAKPQVAKQQSPFQIGSTSSKQHTYYMSYNDTGIIRCKREEADLSMLDVEFHDTSVHHALHVSNTSGYDLAGMSDQAVAFACTDAAEGKNKLECRYFASWDGAKEWSTVMTRKESIQAMTVSTSFVAVATSRQLLRVWTLSGVQSYLATLPGPVVAIASHRDLLAVTYHHAIAGPHQQAMSCQVYRNHYGVLKLLRTIPIPLPHRATLAWLGFSSSGFLCIADSAGLLSMLLCQPSPTWLPISDLRSTLKAKEDRYWLVSVDDELRQAKCILCKDSAFPPCNPRPILSLLDFSPPLCELTTEKAQLELEYLRLHVTTAAADCSPAYPLDDNVVDGCRREETAALMKLFALACKTDRETRALDVCRLLPTEHAMSLAQRYASRLQRINLAQRIDELMEDKAREDELEEEAKLVAGFDSQYSSSGVGASYGASYSSASHAPRSSAMTSSYSSTAAASSSSTAASTTSGAGSNQPRLQPRAQLAERHRQHRKATAARNATVPVSPKPAAPAEPVVTAAEDPEYPITDPEDEEEWAGADDSDGDRDDDMKSTATSRQATTPNSKTSNKKYGGLATANPFQLSGATSSATAASQASPTTPSGRGGSYLDKLSSTTPVSTRKRKPEASPVVPSGSGKTVKGAKSSVGGGGGAVGKGGKRVQASLLSSMSGKPTGADASTITTTTVAPPAAGATTPEPATKGKRGRPKKSVKKSEEAGFTLWLSSHESTLSSEYPHMAATALREEAVQRWSALTAQDKENFVTEAKSAAKAKAGAIFGLKKTSSSTVANSTAAASLDVVMSDSLEDNIVENSLDCTPMGDGGVDDDDVAAIGLHDDRTCMSPPTKRSRGARFIESDDDDNEGEEEEDGVNGGAAKKPKKADTDKASIVAASTKASVQKLAGFAFAK